MLGAHGMEKYETRNGFWYLRLSYDSPEVVGFCCQWGIILYGDGSVCKTVGT